MMLTVLITIIFKSCIFYHCRDSFRTVTASWHESCRKVSVEMRVQLWLSAVRQHRSMTPKQNQRCSLVRGTTETCFYSPSAESKAIAWPSSGSSVDLW